MEISELPLSILHHILSFLPYIDMTRTSVLSKQWNFVRKSFPFIDFQPSNEIMAMSFDAPEFKDRLSQLLDSVDTSLHYFIQNQLCINQLVLDADYMDYDSIPRVNALLPRALHNGLSNLFFRVNVVAERYQLSHYALPETTFSGSSNFLRLEKLSLFMVCLSENMVRDIILNCPNIRYLFLEDILGLETLHISKLDKLVDFSVSLSTLTPTVKSVFVDAPSLEEFSFSVDDDDGYSVNELSCEVDFTCCSNLRNLKLFNSTISTHHFNQHISRFPLLEVLDISLCNSLRRISLSLQRLKHLQVYRCALVSDIEIDAPALSRFDFIECGRLPTIVSSKWSFDPYHSRKPVIPPRVKVGCLDLAGLYASVSWDLLMERLLWSCHPTIVSIPMYSNGMDTSVAILCKMLMQSEQQYRCKVHRCKCWRHRLKEAKIESVSEIGSDGKIGYKQFPHALDTFFSVWSRIGEEEEGKIVEVQFRLDWDLSAVDDLDFLDRISLSSRI